MGSDISITGYEVAPKGFVALPYMLYANDPAWRAPLRMERSAQIDARKNPAMAWIEPRFFLAEREGRTVGRIAAFVNRAHDQAHGGGTAFFGYFDCEDDPAVEDALLGAAKLWAREQGRTRLLGPSMWSVNEECGLLIEGFEHPPAVMMPHGRPHQVVAVERNGFTKQIDMLAYLADLSDGSPKHKTVKMFMRIAERDEGITWRPMNVRDFKGDVALAMDIFNDAWSENWGFLPFSSAQIDHMASEMKPIMFPEGFWVASIDGEPAAFIWMIPDVNEAAEGLDGRLLPFGWAKFLYRLRTRRVRKARVPLMGLRLKHHGTRRGLAAVNRICQLAFDAGHAQGFDQCELSWILEGNKGMQAICDLAGAEHYKTYRMYGAEL